MMIALSRGSRNRAVLMLGLAVVAGGCGDDGGGSASYRDAIAFPDAPSKGSGGAGGMSGADAGSNDGSGGTPADDGSIPVTDGGFPIVDAAPPASTNTLVVAGEGLLVGPGVSCSRPATPAAGAAAPDRWCGVMRPMVTSVSLYVFNLTKALAGTAVTCAPGDPNCFKLDGDLVIDTNAAHGFYGQTLIYYDAAGAYAWRPGWTAGRLLLAAVPMLNMHCEASPADVTTAICIQDDATQTGLNTFAGSIATQAGGVLPAIEPLGGNSSGIGFSPDSLSVIYSVSTAKALPETLKMQTIGDDTSRKVIASGITDWTLSPDGTRWYWLSGPVAESSTGIPIGTVQMAPYPAGTSPVNLQANAFSFTPVGAKSLVTFSAPTRTGGEMRSITDVDNPTTTGTVLQAATAKGVLGVHSNGALLYYDDIIQPDPSQQVFLVNLRTVKVDGTTKCAVVADPSAETSASFTVAGTGVGWIEVLFDDITGSVSAINGNLTTLADCAPHLFSPTVYSYNDVETGLLVQENLDSTVPSADLTYRSFTASGAPSPTITKIQQAADVPVQALQPDVPRVLFSVNGRTSGNGIYASPVLTGAATPDLARAVRPAGNLGESAKTGSATGWASTLAALSRQPLLPLGSNTGPSSWSPSSGNGFSPFARRPDALATRRAFARFAVPPLLRRPSAP
jgi:hypothetical protein